MIDRIEVILRRALPCLRSLIERRRFERELDEELRFHLEMEIEKNVALGMDASEARDRAIRDFGGIARVKEDLRAERGLGIIDALTQDLRSATRVLVRAPGFAAIVILTLALGVGANTAVFAVLRSALLHPLPYDASERLVLLRQEATPDPEAPDTESLGFSVPEIEDYRRSTTTLDAIVEYHAMSFVLRGEGGPERVSTGVVSAGYFDVLGVAALVGRTFRPGEDEPGAPPVLVLGYEYWKRRYHGNPDVVGRELEMNDRRHRVVGVLPPLPRFPEPNDVFMPVSSCPFRSRPELQRNRDGRMMTLIGRLAPGVSLSNAMADVTRVSTSIRREHEAAYRGLRRHRAEIVPLSDEITRRARNVLVPLFVATGIVLLIACSNVFNLMLAELSRRERELALRAAIGAGRSRLLRQLVSEAVLLALVGGAVAVPLGFAVTGTLSSLAARLTPRIPEAHLDLGLLGFALSTSLALGLVLGIVPASIARRGLFTGASPREHRMRARTALVTFQVAASLVLLAGAGLALRSLDRLEHVDVGFESERVLTTLLDLDWSRYRDDASIRCFQKILLRDLRAKRGVVSASLGRTFPLSDHSEPISETFRIESASSPGEHPAVVLDAHAVSADYFRTIGVPLREGRYFDDGDDEASPLVAIVNHKAAARYWPGENPVGKKLSPGKDRWYRIVGVVGDVRQYRLDSDAGPSVYFSISQVPLRVADLLVRTTSDPLDMADEVASAVRRLDPAQAVAFTTTLERARRELTETPRLTSLLLAMFAGLALVITLVGLSGSLGLFVERHTREIGIRLALGAAPTKVFLQVIRQGALVLAGGLVIGLPLALASSRLVSGLLFEVTPHDPVTFSLVSLLLLGASLSVCLIPARRAVSIDPVATLRADG